MPFKIIKVGAGFKVKNTDTNKTYSKKVMTKKNATKQKSILEKYNK